jgi:hypothetical protein
VQRAPDGTGARAKFKWNGQRSGRPLIAHSTRVAHTEVLVRNFLAAHPGLKPSDLINAVDLSIKVLVKFLNLLLAAVETGGAA